MKHDIKNYNIALSKEDRALADLLAKVIDKTMGNEETKIWHGSPVWFLNGNPIVGYSKLKSCIRLLFWSGQSFEEPGLTPEGKFKAAEVRYTSIEQVNVKELQIWLKMSKKIQWDYKNIVKRKGRLERLL